MKNAKEMKRPDFKEIFGAKKDIKDVQKSITNEPELFKYAQQLDLYIDYLADKPIQSKTDKEIETEATRTLRLNRSIYGKAQLHAYRTGFRSCAKGMQEYVEQPQEQSGEELPWSTNAQDYVDKWKKDDERLEIISIKIIEMFDCMNPLTQESEKVNQITKFIKNEFGLSTTPKVSYEKIKKEIKDSLNIIEQDQKMKSQKVSDDFKDGLSDGFYLCVKWMQE